VFRLRIVRALDIPNVCLWHLADIDTDVEHGRSWGVKRTFPISALTSADDPKRTSPAVTRSTMLCRVVGLQTFFTCPCPLTPPKRTLIQELLHLAIMTLALGKGWMT
jgi:hypothetical protein